MEDSPLNPLEVKPPEQLVAQESVQSASPPTHQLWKWLKEHTAIVALIISLISAGFTFWNASNSSRSANASTRSADAAAISASAALTNADWASYQRNPDHNVVARVLKTSTVLRGWSDENTNGFAYVDLALINNGNQSEIIRRVRLYYCDSQDATDGSYSTRTLNTLLQKGEKQVLHLILDRRELSRTNFIWLKIGVIAIDPDARDIESKWTVARIGFAADGNGGSFSELPSGPIRVISNNRLPTQKEVGFNAFME